MIRVLIADDQPMLRTGLRSLLDLEDDIEVVAEAADGDQAVAAARRHRPDVVLMDIRMPHLDGIAATERLMADPEPPRVLVLTTFDLDEYVFRALRAGAGGFLLKDASGEEIARGIRAVARGDALLAPAAARRVIAAFTDVAPPDPALAARLAELSAREVEVLELIGAGRSNAEIAGTLFLSPATVKSHVHRILGKLGLRDRVQAVVFAYECGLVGRR